MLKLRRIYAIHIKDRSIDRIVVIPLDRPLFIWIVKIIYSLSTRSRFEKESFHLLFSTYAIFHKHNYTERCIAVQN